MKNLINFTNPNTHTQTFAYPKTEESPERFTHFTPEEIEESDGYIVSYPYGDSNCAIVGTYKDGLIFITFERDCYSFKLNMLHLVGALAEIWYDTEDIDKIREHIEKFK